MLRSGFKRRSFEEVVEKQRLKSEQNKLKPKKKRGSDPVKTLKDKLWAIFSKYIRKSYADRSGMVLTCDGIYTHWTNTHCGHLINNTERNKQLGGNELWYYEKNFAPQSVNGNYFNANDSSKKYMLFAVQRYGDEEIMNMQRMKQKPRKFTYEELNQKYLYYKEKFDIINS